MNLIDLAIVGVLAISVIFGLYKGFLKSVLNIGLVSWGVALLFYRQFAAWLSPSTPPGGLDHLPGGRLLLLPHPGDLPGGHRAIPIDQVGQSSPKPSCPRR